MQRLTTNDVTRLDVGNAQYAAITDEDGVVIDDTVIYRLPDEDGDETYLFVPNAGTDEATHERWVSHRNGWDLEATVDNRTDEYAMFAVQGPNAADLVDAVTEEPVTELDRFEATDAAVDGVDCWSHAPATPVKTASSYSFLRRRPSGSGRSTTASHAGSVPGYAPDRSRPRPRGPGVRSRVESPNPYEIGIGFTVDLETEFVGRDALARATEAGHEEQLVGFQLIDRGVPRHGYDITNTDGRVVGTVTSGTMSPSLEQPIGLGYVPTEYAEPGTTLQVVVRGQSKRRESKPHPSSKLYNNDIRRTRGSTVSGIARVGTRDERRRPRRDHGVRPGRTGRRGLRRTSRRGRFGDTGSGVRRHRVDQGGLDLYAPAGGEIVSVNEALFDSPELVNDDPSARAGCSRSTPTIRTNSRRCSRPRSTRTRSPETDGRCQRLASAGLGRRTASRRNVSVNRSSLRWGDRLYAIRTRATRMTAPIAHASQRRTSPTA